MIDFESAWNLGYQRALAKTAMDYSKPMRVTQPARGNGRRNAAVVAAGGALGTAAAMALLAKKRRKAGGEKTAISDQLAQRVAKARIARVDAANERLLGAMARGQDVDSARSAQDLAFDKLRRNHTLGTLRDMRHARGQIIN